MIFSPFATYDKLIRNGFDVEEARGIVDKLFSRHVTKQQRLNKATPPVLGRKTKIVRR